MKKRFFSLIIVPDSGADVKTSNFNMRFLIGLFVVLITVFFICFLFIIGYHIKLRQEKNYKKAVSINKLLLKKIYKSEELLSNLSEKLKEIQNNDKVFRHFYHMNVIDDDMYMAGIGGHVIVNESDYSSFDSELQVKLKKFTYDFTSLEHRTSVQEKSLNEIQLKIKETMKIINCTPSIPPTENFRPTSGFGYRYHPISGRRHFHHAVDLGGSLGQKIFATADGVVISAKWQGKLGRCVQINHGYGYKTIYAHLSKIYVQVGQKVEKRDVIATMGNSGSVTGIHVHYGVQLNRKSVNPMEYFYQ